MVINASTCLEVALSIGLNVGVFTTDRTAQNGLAGLVLGRGGAVCLS